MPKAPSVIAQAAARKNASLAGRMQHLRDKHPALDEFTVARIVDRLEAGERLDDLQREVNVPRRVFLAMVEAEQEKRRVVWYSEWVAAAGRWCQHGSQPRPGSSIMPRQPNTASIGAPSAKTCKTCKRKAVKGYVYCPGCLSRVRVAMAKSGYLQDLETAQTKRVKTGRHWLSEN